MLTLSSLITWKFSMSFSYKMQNTTFNGIWSNDIYWIGIHSVYTKHFSIMINCLDK